VSDFCERRCPMPSNPGFATSVRTALEGGEQDLHKDTMPSWRRARDRPGRKWPNFILEIHFFIGDS
jgi:hypothetical protein